MARSRARHTAAKRPSMALTAFASFSALVAVSVAMSNGSAPAPWESAYANESSENQQERGTFGQPQAADQGESRPSLFAAVPNEALISNVQDTPQEYVASQVHNVSDRGTGSAPSSVAPAKRAPATFEGELPVNTIIAPAQPATVLDGGKFGWRTAPDTGEREFHNGTDISTSEGTPVVSALDGTVTAVFWDEWGGNRVEVSHADGVKTTYNHLKDVMVQVGDPLKASEQLGAIGQTGLRVTGPHLHFETWVEGKPVDAQSFDWETGEGIIPASRPKYSLEDQAQTDQSVTDNGSVPGTDNGPMSDVPEDERDQIIALSQETSPAQDVPAESSDSGSESGSGDDGARSGSDGAAPGPAPAPRAAESRPSQAGGSQSPSTESRSAQPSPSRSSSSSNANANDGAEGRVNAGSPSRGTSNATPSRPSGGSTQGGGSGASSNTPRTDSGAKDKAAADKAATDKAAKDKAAKEKAAKEKAAADKAAKDAAAKKAADEKAAADKAEADKAAAEKKAQEEANKVPPAPKPPVEPAPTKPAEPTNPPAPTPTKPAEPTKPADGETPTKPKPPAEPEVPGGPGTPPEAPEPGTDPKDDKPAVNPYTAPITQLTTLEQLQQRTQVFVNAQLALTPEQQFGPGSQLNAQLPLLSQQLVTAGVDQQDPKFTAQLTATQAAVEKAAAAPKDKKLTDAATAELTKLQTMLATVPAYVDTAAAPAG